MRRVVVVEAFMNLWKIKAREARGLLYAREAARIRDPQVQ